MHAFVDDLREGLKRCGVSRERFLVGVSGGADSVALLRGLIEISSECALELCVAHLNHRLRGADSDADAAWVGELAASFNLRCEVGAVANDELSANAGALEENARRLRYEFFDKTAANLACPTIVLAHSADDQTETILHHLLRGTGIAGLRGIPTVRTTASGFRLVRPMLAVRRNMVEAYLQERGQSFRTDATNTDTAMTRNKLRHVVLPMLRDQVNPQVDAAICRLAEQAIQIDEFLTQIVGRILERSRKDAQPDACRIDVRELTDQPKHVLRELFRELWKCQNWPRQAMGFEQWNRLAEMLNTRETITLPNRIEARFHSENLLVLRRLEPSS